MFGVLADNANDAATMNDLALIADLFYGRSYFHNYSYNAAWSL